MTAEHTKTPWSAKKNRINTDDYEIATLHATAKIYPDDAEQEANAAHIVKCVNSHDALVDALEYVLQQLKPEDDTKQCVLYSDMLGPRDDDENIVEYIKQTLTAAKTGE